VRAERSVSATVTPVLRVSGEIRGCDASTPGRPSEAAGPRISSFDEAVEQLAEATGRKIRYVCVSNERCVALLADRDVPDQVVVRLTRVLATLLDG
jgi:uncharacterized protein YbjT (DUF2867 family)